MNANRDGSHELTSDEGTALTLDSKQILWTVFGICLGIVILLFSLDWVINWQEVGSRVSIRKMFSTVDEHSIAGWFAATLTFVVAMAAWAIVILYQNSHATSWQRVGWIVIAVLFSYLSVDDGAAIHEHLGGGLKQTAVVGDVINTYSSYSWHIVILPFFAAIGLFILVFLWDDLNHRHERIGILAAFSCLALAVGQDYIEGTIEEYDWFEATYGIDSPTILHFAKSLEECLEMLGMTLFLVVFLSHLMHSWPSIRLRFI